jgi:hypothetical protein
MTAERTVPPQPGVKSRELLLEGGLGANVPESDPLSRLKLVPSRASSSALTVHVVEEPHPQGAAPLRSPVDRWATAREPAGLLLPND